MSIMYIKHLKALLKKHDGLVNLAKHIRVTKLRLMPHTSIFTDIYKNNRWNDWESVSGVGSNMVQTEVIRDQLPLIWSQLNIKSLLDVPCGDFNWMQHVDLSSITYIGGDIVTELIKHNQRSYSNPECRFVRMDLLTDQLPKVDCILCRDCLVHLSTRHTKLALMNLIKSNSTYLITTTYPNQTSNVDIVTGQWRPINLQVAPFCFPEPLILLKEHSTEPGEKSDKSLGIWRLDSLPMVNSDYHHKTVS